MTDKEKIARSNRAIEFLNSDFWLNDLQPWIEKEKRRLSDEYIGIRLDDKFNKDRERIRTRYTACDIIPGVLKVWKRDKDEIKRIRELKIADNAIKGER